jgi:thioredoxin 1
MNPILMFITSWCPYCKRAIQWVDELKRENPKYQGIEIQIIDEELHPDISKKYDYYYVPTYYVDGVKFYEGATTKNILQDAFDKACE